MGQTATPAPVAPAQPASGPGGADSLDAAVVATSVAPPVHAWLFAPATATAPDATPVALGPRPLVLFLSGCCPVGEPGTHQSWIDHLVRHGNLVLVPDYRHQQELAGVLAALRVVLAMPGVVDRDRIAIVGLSTGATLAANVAAMAGAEGLPAPGALLLLMPEDPSVPLADLGTIAPTTRVLVVVGRDDDVAGERVALRVWQQLARVPLDRRDYVTLVRDDHGEPAGFAYPDLFTQGGARDWYGAWKLLDGLMACAFRGESCAYALGHTPEHPPVLPRGPREKR
jgi:acetyl esterase/lipase